MAREYARLKVSIWNDKDYRALDPYHQGVYNALMAYPDISWCGVIDYIPKRLTEFSDAVGEDELGAAVLYLCDRDFLCLDRSTDEMLLRSFIRHDGVMKMKNVGKAMVNALYRVHSEWVREIVIAELARLYVEDPCLKGWEGVDELAPELLEEVQAKGSLNPSGNSSGGGYE